LLLQAVTFHPVDTNMTTGAYRSGALCVLMSKVQRLGFPVSLVRIESGSVPWLAANATRPPRCRTRVVARAQSCSGQKVTVVSAAVSLTTFTVPSGPAEVPGRWAPHPASADAKTALAATALEIEGAGNCIGEI